jgi:hypothetical protein
MIRLKLKFCTIYQILLYAYYVRSVVFYVEKERWKEKQISCLYGVYALAGDI